MIEQMPRLTASKIMQGKISREPKIKICCGTKIEQITDGDHVEAIELLEISTDGVTAAIMASTFVELKYQNT